MICPVQAYLNMSVSRASSIPIQIPNFLVNITSLVYEMDLIIMMVRVEPIFHGCVIYPIRNGPDN